MDSPNWSKRGFVLLLVGVATALLALIVAPFAGAFFAGAVFATVACPLQGRLSERLGGRRSLAAGLLTLAGVLVVLLPTVLLAAAAIDQVVTLHEHARTTLRQQGPEGLVREVPELLRPAAREVVALVFDGGEVAPTPADGAALDGNAVATVAAVAGRLLDTVAGVAIDLAVTVLAFFFLLAQGHRLVQWVLDVVPLARARTEELLAEFRGVTRGVFLATVATAAIQSVLAAIGYLIAGVDYLAVAVALTFVAAMIPVVGGAVVVAGICLLWLARGDTGYGLFLIVYGAVVVGLSDNIAKPLLAKDAVRLPGSIVLFAMLGGIAVFGPMGIVAGPLIVAFFLATLRLVSTERARAVAT